MPPITVTVLAGPAAGATCTKDAKQKICLGRIKTGNLIPLKDNQVSGKHVEISWDNGCWFALDLDSTNGTRINDSANRCLTGQKYKLRSGDQLHLGPDTTVQVHFDDSPGDNDTVTVEEKLIADAERLAASIKACAEVSVQQIRRDWADQRAQMIQALAHS